MTLYTVTQQTCRYSPLRQRTITRDEVAASGLTHDQAVRWYDRLGFAGVKLHEEREWAVFDAETDDLLAGPFDDRGECEKAQRELIAHGHHARHLTIGAIL